MWQTVAEGASFAELRSLIEDMELPKGTKVKVVMDLKVPIGWAFDAPGAEWLFRPLIPSGLELVDVYGGGSQGIVEMEADPVWLVALLAFIKAHWVSILIALFVLGVIIFFIRVMVEIVGPGPFGIPWWVLLVGGAAIAVPLIMRLMERKKET
ncbi:hypothetical protein ES703_112671 [subsurface metagenome]